MTKVDRNINGFVVFVLFRFFIWTWAVCGVRGRSNRIVGGNPTSANEYPWMVGLYRNGRLYCGGALISTKHVLTAAHCVHSFDRKDIKIYVGGHNISTDYVDTRRVGRVLEHEYFDTATFDFDIAILELSKPVQFGAKVQPACLPQTQFADYSGKSAMIAGWGRLGMMKIEFDEFLFFWNISFMSKSFVSGEQGQTSDYLRQVIVPIWTTEECGESDYGKKRLTGNMMCAGFKDGGKDACQGNNQKEKDMIYNLQIELLKIDGSHCLTPVK